MPALEDYDIDFDVTNDMRDTISIQLLRDYGSQNGPVVLLYPEQSLTLILESGSTYQYAVKFRTRVASVTVRSWRNIDRYISQLFNENLFNENQAESSSSTSTSTLATNEVRVDRWWREYPFGMRPSVFP